jgi:hypothetical protein
MEDCERLLDNIRALIAEPNMSMLGGNDEEDAEKQMSAGKPKVQRGAAVGRRGEKSAKPLMSIESLAPEGGRDYRSGGSQFRRQDYW